MENLNATLPILRGFGFPFNSNHSSCSDIIPKTFRWSAFSGDYDVYIDHAMKQHPPDASVPLEKRFGWLCESRFIVPDVYDWLYKNHEQLLGKFYNKIFTCEETLLNLNPNFVYCPNGSNYPWVRKNDWRVYEKTKTCSILCSHKQITEGHVYRHSVSHIASEYGFDTSEKFRFAPMAHQTLWSTKIDSLRDYMFHIVVENGRSNNYYTEKVTDCFTTGTIPVYYGTDKVLEDFDPAGIIVLTPGKEREIFDSLNVDLYNSKLQAVQNNFDRINRLQLADDFLFQTLLNF
jgi:hypothetical protein